MVLTERRGWLEDGKQAGNGFGSYSTRLVAKTVQITDRQAPTVARPNRVGNQSVQVRVHLDEHVGIGQVDSEVADLGEHDAVQLAATESLVDLFSVRLRGLARHQGRAELLSDRLDLREVLTDDENAPRFVLIEQLL